MNELENEFVKLAQDGDHQAFAKLVSLYQSKIYHLCYRMLGNKQEAEDATQETFMRVYINFKRYDQQQKFSTWIFRIATNWCIDKLRQRKQISSLDARQHNNESESSYLESLEDNLTPESQVIVNETQAYIQNIIEQLPVIYKAPIMLKYMNDFSLQEISEVLNVPVSTVKVRMHRAREYLRRKIELQNV